MSDYIESIKLNKLKLFNIDYKESLNKYLAKPLLTDSEPGDNKVDLCIKIHKLTNLINKIKTKLFGISEHSDTSGYITLIDNVLKPTATTIISLLLDIQTDINKSLDKQMMTDIISKTNNIKLKKSIPGLKDTSIKLKTLIIQFKKNIEEAFIILKKNIDVIHTQNILIQAEINDIQSYRNNVFNPDIEVRNLPTLSHDISKAVKTKQEPITKNLEILKGIYDQWTNIQTRINTNINLLIKIAIYIKKDTNLNKVHLIYIKNIYTCYKYIFKLLMSVYVISNPDNPNTFISTSTLLHLWRSSWTMSTKKTFGMSGGGKIDVHDVSFCPMCQGSGIQPHDTL